MGNLACYRVDTNSGGSTLEAQPLNKPKNKVKRAKRSGTRARKRTLSNPPKFWGSLAQKHSNNYTKVDLGH